MPKEYDFSKGKRGVVIEAFRVKAEASGRGYQTMMNEALRAAIDPESAPVTLCTLRAVLDERFALVA
ncbi:MAG: BrnA antitoxin family protein [Giesbergeria sp.]|uniref:BrnA antitoxin family protein n=1 Tax=Giesbergeria sp. TaxID=2818473 RepID=UPI0026225D57|nr:BrnA antitoxin family protein [Giesbergeria sp.]MDD2611011.1 BrnA antitoxin family protein [Giesbergeria sp.]